MLLEYLKQKKIFSIKIVTEQFVTGHTGNTKGYNDDKKKDRDDFLKV